MVASPFKLKILEWDVKQLIINQSIQTPRNHEMGIRNPKLQRGENPVLLKLLENVKK
jgi:hypothetical protein